MQSSRNCSETKELTGTQSEAGFDLHVVLPHFWRVWFAEVLGQLGQFGSLDVAAQLD